MREWLRNHPIDVIELVVGIIGVSTIVWLIDQVRSMFLERTAAAVAVTLCAAFLGAVVGRWATRRIELSEPRRMRVLMEALTDGQVLAIAMLYRLGAEAAVPSYDVCVSLEALGIARRLSCDRNVTAWDLTDVARKAILSDRKLREEIEGLEIKPGMRRNDNRREFLV